MRDIEGHLGIRGYGEHRRPVLIAQGVDANLVIAVGQIEGGLASSTGGDLMAELSKLADLKAAGVLTDEEFAAAKAKLLA